MAHPLYALPTLGPAEASMILREPVYAVTPLGQGVRSRVYRVESEEGAVRVVRLTPRGAGRVAREAWVRTKLRRHPDAPLPTEVAVHHVPLAQQVDVVTMAELPGATMFAAMRTMFEPEIRELYTQFGAALGAIHTVAVEGFGLIDAAGHGPFPSWQSALEALARAGLEEARVSPLSDLADRAEATVAALLGPALAPGFVTAAALLHGDAQPMNVHVHRGRINAVFDFEFASGGDPAYELAYVEPLFEPSPAHPGTATPEDLAARRAAFYTGYARNHAPPDDNPPRTRLYRLIHALRGTEFLSVVGPQLAAPVREQTTHTMRDGLARWL